MTDQKETATTMWQDHHDGKRGHQLMTQKLAETIPALYANENVAGYDTVLAIAKLVSPYSNWTWYITEMDAATGQCFGLVDGLEREIGYFDLTELAETTVFGDVPAVERDLYWEPRSIGEIKGESQGNSQQGQKTGVGETMSDESEREAHSQDVVNLEEFLFGGVTEETAEDAPADADTEAAGGEPGVADGAAEQPSPSETETSDELKVVLSIRGNRAIIGVQRPSADPHIESFDDPDLFRLADQFPAVVARAKARWEEEPMHPAYVRPTPPPRQRARRQQAPIQAATAENDTEAQQQQQPETLRLF